MPDTIPSSTMASTTDSSDGTAQEEKGCEAIDVEAGTSSSNHEAKEEAMRNMKPPLGYRRMPVPNPPRSCVYDHGVRFEKDEDKPDGKRLKWLCACSATCRASSMKGQGALVHCRTNTGNITRHLSSVHGIVAGRTKKRKEKQEVQHAAVSAHQVAVMNSPDPCRPLFSACFRSDPKAKGCRRKAAANADRTALVGKAVVQLSVPAIKDLPSRDTPPLDEGDQHQKHDHPSTNHTPRRGARGPGQEGRSASSGRSSSNELGTPDRGVTTAVEDRDIQREVIELADLNSRERQDQEALLDLHQREALVRLESGITLEHARLESEERVNIARINLEREKMEIEAKYRSDKLEKDHALELARLEADKSMAANKIKLEELKNIGLLQILKATRG